MSKPRIESYAFLIGVGSTAWQNWSLPVTVRDVEVVHGILTDEGLCGFVNDANRMCILKNSDATRQGILIGLNRLAQHTSNDPNATVVIYYSGHGFADKATGRYFLLPHDAKPFNISGSAISGEEFTAALLQIPARRVLVFLDTCHAAGMTTAKDQPIIEIPDQFIQAAMPKGLVDDLKQGAGRAVFSSSTGEQKSWVRPDGSLSIYTYHLIEAFQGAGSQPGDTVVRLSNLVNHLSKAVPKSAREMCDAEQTPFYDWSTEDFPVALLRGGKGLPSGGWAAVEREAAERIASMQITGDANVIGNSNVVQVVKAEGGSRISGVAQIVRSTGSAASKKIGRR